MFLALALDLTFVCIVMELLKLSNAVPFFQVSFKRISLLAAEASFNFGQHVRGSPSEQLSPVLFWHPTRFVKLIMGFPYSSPILLSFYYQVPLVALQSVAQYCLSNTRLFAR